MVESRSKSASAEATKIDEAATRPGEDTTVATSKPESGLAEEDKSVDTNALTEEVAKATIKESDDTQAATEAAEGDAATGTEDATPNGAADKKDLKKRRSSTGVPEHKKQRGGKKKAVIELHLDVQPGEYWWARMKGWQKWPVIICDEEILPESLLIKRPVSAARPDGTYREDFQDGGKNVKDRRYPVMFMGTNEFAWTPNTELSPLDKDELKKDVEAGEQGKRAKNLWGAYQDAAKDYGLDHYKAVLHDHEEAMEKDRQEQEAKEQAKKDKADKTRRKSTAKVDPAEDIEMEDAEDGESTKKAKGSKKRKNADSDADAAKPLKTPKKLKLNVSKEDTPKSTKSTKTKKTPKAKASEEESEAKPEEVSPEAAKEKRSKFALFLRHKLQKGFLTRDKPPQEDEMAGMADFFGQLENQLKDLDADIIKSTKIDKVLKGILKLSHIPKDEEFSFKKRSEDLLKSWAPALASFQKAQAANETKADGEPTTNGVKSEDKKENSGSPAAADAATNGDVKETVEEPKPTDAVDGDTLIDDSIMGGEATEITA